jgi:hypothetical protein
VDYSRYDPAINVTYFPNVVSSLYWAATTNAYGTGSAWGVYFYGGYDGNSYKASSYYVRAVRGGQSRPLGPSVISVSPASRAVAKDAGATTFSVSNTGTGTMPWTATVTSGDSWLSISAVGLSETIPERLHAASWLIPAHPRVLERFGLRRLAQRAAPRM